MQTTGVMPGGLMPNGTAHINGYGGMFEPHEEDKLRAVGVFNESTYLLLFNVECFYVFRNLREV